MDMNYEVVLTDAATLDDVRNKDVVKINLGVLTEEEYWTVMEICANAGLSTIVRPHPEKIEGADEWK